MTDGRWLSEHTCAHTTTKSWKRFTSLLMDSYKHTSPHVNPELIGHWSAIWPCWYPACLEWTFQWDYGLWYHRIMTANCEDVSWVWSAAHVQIFLRSKTSHVKRNKTLLASMPSFVVSRELVIENTARSKHVSLTIGLTASYTISQN